MTLKEFQSKDMPGGPTPDDARLEAALKHREELIELCQKIKDSVHIPYELIDKLVAKACGEKTAVQLAAEKGFEGT